jgi:glutaminyl-peptide cyclotransferase
MNKNDPHSSTILQNHRTVKNVKRQILFLFLYFFPVWLMYSCGSSPESNLNDPADQPAKKQVTVPAFNPDSAYLFIEKQVNFGPRVPGTPGHEATRKWLTETLNSYADKVIEQPFDAITYKGERLKATNIIAVFNPEAKRRILLGAHWDTRAIADHDPDPDKRNQPIPGADDGGSGVGVLLEIARNLHLLPVEIGVDIVMFDAEDQGADTGNNPESWCLGAQHWSSNPHVKGYKADFGILLDMVGSKGARFTLEGVSMQFAPDVMNRIWKMAQSMGYGGYFVSERTGPITDDHYFVNTIARIPMINIINRPKNTETGFGQYWHTHADNMDVIDKNTLRAVGQVVLAVLYRTEGGSFL